MMPAEKGRYASLLSLIAIWATAFDLVNPCMQHLQCTTYMVSTSAVSPESGIVFPGGDQRFLCDFEISINISQAKLITYSELALKTGMTMAALFAELAAVGATFLLNHEVKISSFLVADLISTPEPMVLQKLE